MASPWSLLDRSKMTPNGYFAQPDEEGNQRTLASEAPPRVMGAPLQAPMQGPTWDQAAQAAQSLPGMQPAMQPGMPPMLHKNTDTEKDVDKLTDVHANMLDPAQMAQAYKNWSSLEPVQSQTQDIENYRKLAGLQADLPVQTDLTPLMKLTDAWTGSKFAPGYQAPATPQASLQAAMESAQKIMGAKRDLAKEAMDSITKQKAGTITSAQETALTAQMMAQDPALLIKQTPMENRIRALSTSVQKDLNEGKEANKNLKEANLLLASGQSVTDTIFREKLARALIGGRLSNYDQQVMNGDRSFLGVLDNIKERLQNGTLSTMSRKEFQDAARVLGDANSQQMNTKLAYWRGVGSLSYQIPDDRLDPIVNPKGFDIGPISPSALATSAAKSRKALAPPPQQKAAQAPANPLMDAVAAEMAKRKAAAGH